MKTTELASLFLAALYDFAESNGHLKSVSLDEVAAENGEKDGGKVREAAKYLHNQGLINALISSSGTSAWILGPGSIAVEEGGKEVHKYRKSKTTVNPFPAVPAASLTREQVIEYLLLCRERGWCEAHKDGANGFLITTAGNNKISINVNVEDKVAHINWQPRAAWDLAAKAENLSELESAIAKAAALYGEQWPTKLTRGRLADTTPATNLATYSRLITPHEIEAVFDPYFDNKTLVNLLNILSLGGSLSDKVRFITGENMTRGNTPRLTKSFLQQWFKERGVTSGEMRLVPAGSEHCRFMLLSGGQALRSGCSFNEVAKNEFASIESDTEHRPFFDSVWATATPF
jgi:hypothetical protein